METNDQQQAAAAGEASFLDEAWIGGRSGVAVILDGDLCLRMEAFSELLIACEYRELSQLVAEDPTAFAIEAGDAPYVEVRRRLEWEWRVEGTLQQVFRAANAKSPAETRREAGRLANRCLRAPQIAEAVRNRLLSDPLPPFHKFTCYGLRGQVRVLVSDALAQSHWVNLAAGSWNASVRWCQLSPEQVAQCRRRLVDDGGFVVLGQGLRQRDLGPFARWIQRFQNRHRGTGHSDLRHRARIWKREAERSLAWQLEADARFQERRREEQREVARKRRIKPEKEVDKLIDRCHQRVHELVTALGIPKPQAERFVRDILLSSLYRWHELKDHEHWFFVTLTSRCLHHLRDQGADLAAVVERAIRRHRRALRASRSGRRRSRNPSWTVEELRSLLRARLASFAPPPSPPAEPADGASRPERAPWDGLVRARLGLFDPWG